MLGRCKWSEEINEEEGGVWEACKTDVCRAWEGVDFGQLQHVREEGRSSD